MLIDLIRVPDPGCIDDLLDEPLGLMYLASVLRSSGYDVRLINLAGHSFESWKGEIKDADIYGIQLYTPTAKLGIKIAGYIKDNFPGRPVICGGAHPSAVPQSKELEIFDKIIVGEGEVSILEAVSSYGSGRITPRIIKSNFIENLDSLPFPSWDLVDMMGFHRKVDGQRCFGIIGSRGCSYRCAFCDQALFGGRVRFRSIQNIIREIREIIRIYDVRNFEFFDDMFTVDKRRLIEFKDNIKGLDIAYRCNGRTDILLPEVYGLLKETGCKVVCFGIESGSQRMLERMNKRNTVENNFKAIKIAQEAGLIVIGYFILGFPGETKATIDESLDFIEKSGIDQAQFYTFTPLPGCDVYKFPEKYGAKIIADDFSEYYLVTGKEGLGGRTVETESLSADELLFQMRRVRQFLKNRVTRGKTQDYYKEELKYKVCDD